LRITNINSLSALIDRLVSENIKLFFFKKDGLKTNVKHQEKIITAIKQELGTLFLEVTTKGYNYLEEQRTFKGSDIVESIEELVKANIHVGEADRAKLKEALSKEPNVDKLVINQKLMRKANEKRSKQKNIIDKKIKKVLK